MSELDEIKVRFQAVYDHMSQELSQAHAKLSGVISELAHVKALLAAKIKEAEQKVEEVVKDATSD